jgi:hypothetical protein
MTATKNSGVRCDGCGRISRHPLGECRDTDDDYCDECEAARALPNHWRERDALAADAVHPRRCVHGVPLNVFCGRCEA